MEGSESLVFPSSVMEHLSEEQIELLYDRYLSKTITRDLMDELNVRCQIAQVISHFPYVEVDTEYECHCSGEKFFSRRKNFIGNGPDWGVCGDCGHKISLRTGDAVDSCSCNGCKEIRAAQEAYRRERAAKLEDDFWQAFQQNNTIATAECSMLDDLSPLDVYITHLLIQFGCIDENGILDPLYQIQKKLLLFPALEDFYQYVIRMFDASAIGYAWTDYTKSGILNAHDNSFEQKEYLDSGRHSYCFDSVHLKLTIQSSDEECDCDTVKLADLCGKNGCRVARFMTPEEISRKYEVYVAPPNKPCINSEEDFWKTIEKLQMMELGEFLRAQEKIVGFTIVQEELPTIYEAIARARKCFSPSQCAYFIQKALRDAVVFYQSENCKGKTHACRTIKNNMTRLIEKANSEGWKLSNYSRLKYSVIPKVALSYYSEVLGFVDDNDPSWYMSVEDIKKRFLPSRQSEALTPSVEISGDAEFMPLSESGNLATTQLLEEFTCVNCHIKGDMHIGVNKVDRLIIHCAHCKVTYRYKFFDTILSQ